MADKKPNHYVDNRKFFQEILLYKKSLRKAKRLGLPEPRIPEYLGECIFKIAQNLSYKPCFLNYSYRDEMVSDGIENAILYFKDYNPKIGQNPFAYFTQIVYYAFIRRINKEEKNRYAVYKHFQHTIIHGSNNNSPLDNHMDPDMIMNALDTGDNSIVPAQIYDNINEFMHKFERKEHERKVKRKRAKRNLEKFL